VAKTTGRPRKKRALAHARRGGRLGQRGDASVADLLVGALVEARRNDDLLSSLTHPVHSYPARMHPATARSLVQLAMDGRDRATILDPFCGSGTTLVEARYAGAKAVGVDANPLAVSIARAKTWTVKRARLGDLRRNARRIADKALAEAKAARRAGYVAPPDRVLPGVDAGAREKALSGWFPRHVRRELEFIGGLVDGVGKKDKELGEILTVMLSAILYKVSRRASDSDPSRVERRIARGAASRLFRERTELLLAGLEELAGASRAPRPRAHLGNATALDDKLKAVDAIITSPPYPGTYDYAEHHRLRLDFLGLKPHKFRSAEMGARRRFSGSKWEQALKTWRNDFAASLAQMFDALEPGGQALLVMGDSLAGPRALLADKEVSRLRPEGTHIVAHAWEERPKLGAAERRAFGDKAKREHIFCLRRE
jgi:SAM-dependent methyltransferase